MADYPVAELYPDDVGVILYERHSRGVLNAMMEAHEEPDVTSPVIGNVSPAPGTPITSTTPLVLEVTDDSGALRRVLLTATYSAGALTGVTELLFDGDAFVGHYVGGRSGREPIPGGFRFTLLRDTGWPASPTIRVFAFDRSGNEI